MKRPCLTTAAPGSDPDAARAFRPAVLNLPPAPRRSVLTSWLLLTASSLALFATWFALLFVTFALPRLIEHGGGARCLLDARMFWLGLPPIVLALIYLAQSCTWPYRECLVEVIPPDETSSGDVAGSAGGRVVVVHVGRVRRRRWEWPAAAVTRVVARRGTLALVDDRRRTSLLVHRFLTPTEARAAAATLRAALGLPQEIGG